MFKFDIVGIDSPCMDLAVNLEKYPRANISDQVEQLSWQGGGKIATGMVAAARLGAKGAIMGNVGDDLYGKFCIKDFKEHNINTQYLKKRESQTTGFSIVLSDQEHMGRSILYRPGTCEPLTIEELPLDYLENTRYFFVSMISETVKRATRIAKAAGAKIIIDADTYSDELNDFIPLVDVFVGSEFVYGELFPEAGDFEKNLRSVMARGPQIVVFTYGEKGAKGVSEEGYFEIPAFQVTVQDTLGAGDVFHGAFIVGLLNDFSVKETTRFASAVSAIKCTRIGGRAGIPDFETTMKFLQTGEIDYTQIDQRVTKYQRGLDDV